MGCGAGARGWCGSSSAKLPVVLNAISAGRIWLCTQPTDMRCSFDGLSARVRRHLGQDPTSGHWFVFINRRRSLLKILAFDTGGYWIWSKRLEQGQFGPHGGAKEGETDIEPNGFAGATRRDRYANHTIKKTISKDYLNDSMRDRFAPGRLDNRALCRLHVPLSSNARTLVYRNALGESNAALAQLQADFQTTIGLVPAPALRGEVREAPGS